MKPILTLVVILALLAAVAEASAEQGSDHPAASQADESKPPPANQPAGSWTDEPGILPASQPAGGRTAQPESLPTSAPESAAVTPHADATSRIEKLREQLKSADPKARAAAATKLVWVKESAAVDLLVRALADDPSAQVRRAAAESLGLRDARSALVPLTRAASHDTSPAVKRAAALAVHQLELSSDPDRRTIPGLTTKKAGTAIAIGGSVVGASLMVAGFVTVVAVGMSNSRGMGFGPKENDLEPRPPPATSDAPAYLLVSGVVIIVASIVTGLIMRSAGSSQMIKAIDPRRTAAISSSRGRLDLTWTF